MNQIVYKNESLNVIFETEVLVVGAGPAGVGAAISAARQGAKVILIEQREAAGGMATIGMMSHFAGRADSKILTEMLDRQEAFENRKNINKNVINPEVLKLIILQMLEEANVESYFNIYCNEAIVEDGIVKGVIINSKSGRGVILAKVVIDCTGDGDLAVSAGANYIKGRESDNKMQPVTLMFKVAGVDESKAVYLASFESKYQTEKGELQALAKEKMPHPLGHVLLYKTSLPGVVTCNMTNVIGIDGTCIKDLAKAEILCRKQMFMVQDFLREFVPGYENCFVISSASFLGVRETRHIIGEDSINENDILQAKIFKDWIVKNARFNFDVHNISGAGLDKTGVQEKFNQPEGYTIPYGCFIPKGLENLFVAGRSISGTHMAHSNYRVMPICVAMGEGVGIAAALSVKNKTPIREIDVKQIQNIIEG